MDPNLVSLLGLTGGTPAPVNPNIMTNPPMTPKPIAPGSMPAPANPNVMTDPTAQAAAVLASSGAQPPGPMAKPATAMLDRNGAMLPMTSGGMDSYYNDVPDPSQPLTAAGVQTPKQKAMIGAGQSAMSGLQDIVNPKTEAPKPPAPVSPPGPTVRPDMSALTQMVLQAAQRPQADPRKAGLAALLMRG